MEDGDNENRNVSEDDSDKELWGVSDREKEALRDSTDVLVEL